MKFRDILALILVMAVAIGGKIHRDGIADPPPQRRPDPRQFEPAPAPELPAGVRRPLPPPAASDPRISVEVEKKNQAASGSAFSLDSSGIWITAHHVTEGCDLVAIQRRDGRLVRAVRVAQQSFADISVLWTAGGTPALPVASPQLNIGDDAYSFGFPQGEPGDVHARLIGRSRMLAHGRYETDEPVLAWTHVRRIPDRGAYLGGISGGPWIDGRGEVIGVHVAGAPRRGRSYSTTPEALVAAIRTTAVSVSPDPNELPSATLLSPEKFGHYGDDLRRRQTVAKVVCLVGDEWRRPDGRRP